MKTKDKLYNISINNVIQEFLTNYNNRLLSEEEFNLLENKTEYLNLRINDIILYHTDRYRMELRDFEYLSLNNEQKKSLINDKLLKEEILNNILFNELEAGELESYLNNRIKCIEDHDFDTLTDYEIVKLTEPQKERFQKIRWYNYINEPRINYTKLEYNLLDNKYKVEYINIRYLSILRYNNPHIKFLNYEWELLTERKRKKYFDWLYTHLECGMIDIELLLGDIKTNLYNNYIKSKFDQLTEDQKILFVKNKLEEIIEFNNPYAKLQKYEFNILTEDQKKIYFDFYIPYFNSKRGYKPEKILRDCYNEFLEYTN
jgi:hypothetical protein